MRDPMSWSIPLFRMFGIQVRIHLLFFIVTLGLFLRQVSTLSVAWYDIFFLSVFALFVIILMHEFGHCFGGRSVGGDAEEILLWPLGGLAYVDVPRNWRAHTWMVFCGPLTNLLICLVCALVIISVGFVPKLNPIANPYVCTMHNFREGRDYTSDYGLRLYQKDTGQSIAPTAEWVDKLNKPQELHELLIKTPEIERALAPLWLVWLQRIFWLSWILFLFNMLPAYPLDGGQILQGLIWAKADYRQGTTTAGFIGYIVGILFVIAAIALNEALLIGLGLFIVYSSHLKIQSLLLEDSPYGDFSGGYSTLDEEEKPRKPRRPNFLKRWWQARAHRRLQREHALREAEDQRMDALLEKIAQLGENSLSQEERIFMKHISERYRKQN